MNVTVIQKTKKYNVNGTQVIKRYEVTIAPLGKRGFSGLNAYELAVKNGTFVGTEEEYLTSLKGEPGDLTALGNYERDWAQDFLIALNT